MSEGAPIDALDIEVDRQVRAWRARIAEQRARPLAIEALWDGDTDGWCLDITLVTKADGSEAAFVAVRIATLRTLSYGASTWPEAVVARRAGEQVGQELGIDFYFPSPDSPDDDCPHWWEREAAVRCRSCGKLLKRDPGAYAVPDQCAPCRQSDEWRQKLLTDEPGYSGNQILYCVLERDHRAVRRLFLNRTYAPAARLVAELAAALRRQEPPVECSNDIDATLDAEHVVALRAFCAEEIDRRLDGYTRRRDLPAHVMETQLHTWRGVEWPIDQQFDPAGSQLSACFHHHAFFDACADGSPLRLYGNGGVTYRDLEIMRRAVARGGTILGAELREALPFLPADAVERTLAKLARRGMIARDGDRVELLLKGHVIGVAGP